MIALYMIAACIVVVVCACAVSPYMARLVAAVLRSHAAAMEAAQREYVRVFGRCARAAAFSARR